MHVYVSIRRAADVFFQFRCLFFVFNSPADG